MLKQPKKIFSGLALLTFVLLFHVHMQVSIFQVSYSIQKKSKLLSELTDEYRLEKYEISKLYSLSYLDKRKKELNLNLVVPKEVKVVYAPVERVTEQMIDAPPMIRRGLFSFANLIKEAQAKTSRE